ARKTKQINFAGRSTPAIGPPPASMLTFISAGLRPAQDGSPESQFRASCISNKLYCKRRNKVVILRGCDFFAIAFSHTPPYVLHPHRAVILRACDFFDFAQKRGYCRRP